MQSDDISEFLTAGKLVIDMRKVILNYINDSFIPCSP